MATTVAAMLETGISNFRTNSSKSPDSDCRQLLSAGLVGEDFKVVVTDHFTKEVNHSFSFFKSLLGCPKERLGKF